MDVLFVYQAWETDDDSDAVVEGAWWLGGGAVTVMNVSKLARSRC